MKSVMSVFILALVIGVSSAAQEPGSDGELVFVIEIHGEIDRVMMIFVRRGLEQARAQEADIVVFDIDTFGGRVDSALQITSLIGASQTDLTIAFVTSGPEGTGVSWSAGALISFACDRIYMAPGTSIGAAAPVYQTPQGMEMAPEKVVSALRTQMAALAEKNGYPKGIALGMVDEDVELWEADLDGELLIVTTEEYELAERDAEKSGKTLEKGRSITQKGKLLALTAGEMERYGVSSGTMADLEELCRSMGVATPKIAPLAPTVPDQTVAVLTSTAVTTLLVLVGLIALFFEVTSPGFGVPGTIAVVCFAVLFTGHFLLGTVGSLELLLFIAGLALLIIELLVIPGFGVTGVLGILLIVISLVLAMQSFVWPELDWEWDILRRNLLLVLLSLTGSLVFIGMLARFVPRFAPFRRLMLTVSQRPEQGYTVQAREVEEQLVGKRGRAMTTLRPVGKAEFGDDVLVVETEGQFIQPGTEVVVCEVNGNRVVVRAEPG